LVFSKCGVGLQLFVLSTLTLLPFYTILIEINRVLYTHYRNL
jgi:hypothetical protein